MITLSPGNKLRVTFSWTYSGPAGNYYAMVQIGNARAGFPFGGIVKTVPVIFPTSQTQVVVDVPIDVNTPEGVYEVEVDICTDASGTDQSILAYKQGPLNDIQVTTEGVFSNLVVSYTKV